MKNFTKHMKMTFINKRGFVLPFTLLISAIMLLISVSISTILTKQIYFSNLSRDSQIAYYAADNALSCALSIDETYVDDFGIGIFPYSSSIPVDPIAERTAMEQTLASIQSRRAATTPAMTPLAPTLNDIQCAQSRIFVPTSPYSFTINQNVFSRIVPAHGAVPASTEIGRTSSFFMKMDLGDGSTFRCAKITINKTQSYRQIISQGFSRCDRPDGTIERAIINTSLLQ
ncbi:MAG: pilus assembly PilX N-terminal domain-containing protein [Candidatus Pacebacteria bacterium]|nr:pilus assembly PilX N-terminal domain-containing protein [Candidatus Paceibacterota bacterium]